MHLLPPQIYTAGSLGWSGNTLSGDSGKSPFWQFTLLGTEGVDLA